MSVRDKLRAAGISRKLEENHRRRVNAAAEINAARDELVTLLRQGRGVVPVTKMCQLAGISRTSAYQLFDGGEFTPAEIRTGLANQGGTK